MIYNDYTSVKFYNDYRSHTKIDIDGRLSCSLKKVKKGVNIDQQTQTLGQSSSLRAALNMKLSPRNSFDKSNTWRLVKRKALRELLSHLTPSGLYLFIPFLKI